MDASDSGGVLHQHEALRKVVLLQVVGRKYVRLYRPDATPALYPFEKVRICVTFRLVSQDRTLAETTLRCIF